MDTKPETTFLEGLQGMKEKVIGRTETIGITEGEEMEEVGEDRAKGRDLISESIF